MHGLDDCAYFRAGTRMQENVSVEVGEITNQRGREINRQLAKKCVLLIERQNHEGGRRIGGAELTQEIRGLLPAFLGDEVLKFRNDREIHGLNRRTRSESRAMRRD